MLGPDSMERQPFKHGLCASRFYARRLLKLDVVKEPEEV
jgi:hypothetical protein